MTVDVVIEDPRWAGLPALAEPAVAAALEGAGLDADDYEVALLGCDDARIADLNGRFRGRAAPTNVLSFPAAELAPGDPPPEELGDVAIAYDTCAREAAEQGKPMDAHVTHLIVHAVLHLLGHDHADDAGASLMEGLERTILGGMGLPDPYADGGGAPDGDR
ncbi:MAG: rRNA maturation RNase YbeY [Hasllibacter sp.]